MADHVDKLLEHGEVIAVEPLAIEVPGAAAWASRWRRRTATLGGHRDGGIEPS